MTPDTAIEYAARARWERMQDRLSARWPRILWDEISEELRAAQVDEMRRIACDLEWGSIA